jgi:tetraacyldisaccharide 4'-kinase
MTRPTDQRMTGFMEPDARRPTDWLLRAATRCAAWGYGSVTAIRNRAYDRRLLKTHPADLPVISIGNLTTGGTGKTPMVIWAANMLGRHGHRPAIVLRGYKSNRHGESDEAALLGRATGDLPVIVNPDRVAAAAEIRQSHKQVDVLLLDDAFAHRRIARDLDIVLIDASNPFGHGHLLPRGLLRESPGGLRRADAVVVTHADLLDESHRDQLSRTIQAHHGREPLAWAMHRWVELIDHDGRSMEPGARSNGSRVYPFCGIGNPHIFFQQAGRFFDTVGGRIFDDHHAYTPAELTWLDRAAADAGADAMLTTEKDWVKIAPLLQSGQAALTRPLWYPRMEMGWLAGEQALTRRIGDTLKGNRAP